MSRLPIRVRLTLAFAAATALVLAAAAAFVYVQLRAGLDESIDDALAARAATVARTGDAAAGLTGDAEDGFAVVIGGDRAGAARGPIERVSGDRDVPGIDGTVRVLARGDVVVGQSLDDRDEVLAGLIAAFAIGGPLAIVLASLLGYALAGSAMRPVEAMRRRAAEISADTTGERLPVPASHDEIHRLGTTLNEMLDRLDAGLLRERRFVADASHELRTPLALLKAELELALRRPRTPEEQTAALRSAAEEADRLVGLAEGLLLLATAEDAALRREPVAARELVARVVARFGVEAGEAEGELDADPVRLEAALGNLVENALRHGAPPVVVSARREGDRIVLAVADAGPGFPPGFLERAFDRFARADDARTEPGAGLGLAIAAAVARAHGGEATARNLSGAGAEVALVLPARLASSPS
jgi:signal transduction histidine kinase